MSFSKCIHLFISGVSVY